MTTSSCRGGQLPASDIVAHWRLGAKSRVALTPPIAVRVDALRLSSDGGQRVVVDGLGNVQVVTLPGGAPVASFAKSSYDDAWFWPPQAQLAIAGSSFVDVAPLPTGTVQSLPAAQVDGQLVAMSPDGGLLAFDAASAVVVRDRAGNLQRSIARSGTDQVAFSPTGDRLAMGLSDGSLQILSLTGGADVPPVTAHAHGVLGVTFTPDGGSVISAGGDGLGILWSVTTLSEVRSFTVGSEPLQAVAVSPDGTLVALGIGATIAYQAKLFRIADASLLATFHGMQEYASIGTITFTSDGNRLIIGGTDGTIRTWCLP